MRTPVLGEPTKEANLVPLREQLSESVPAVQMNHLSEAVRYIRTEKEVVMDIDFCYNQIR